MDPTWGSGDRLQESEFRQSEEGFAMEGDLA